jgi:hypothetical protein
VLDKSITDLQVKHRYTGTLYVHDQGLFSNKEFKVVHFQRKNHGLFNCIISTSGVALGGLVVSVLATEPKVRGFKPGRGRWILRVIKSVACLPLEGKYSHQSHVVDLWHVKEPYKHDWCSSAKFSGHFSPVSLLRRESL